MKTLLRFGLLLTAASCLLFASCQKLESTASSVDSLPKATVKIIAASQNNIKSYDAKKGYLGITSGKAIFQASYKSLGIGESEEKYTVEVNLSARDITVELPVGVSGTMYDVTFTDYIAKHTDYSGNTRQKIYRCAGTTPQVPELKPGSSVIVKVLYKPADDAVVQG